VNWPRDPRWKQTSSSWMRCSVAVGLVLLFFAQPALAWQASGQGFSVASDSTSGFSSSLPDAPLPEAAELTITILDGEGALNNIRQRTAREPIVQVEDKNHKPVAGALVLFAINDGSGGAGATVNGLTSLSVRTGVDGKAQLHGLQPNNVSGEFSITVTATVGTMVATVIIHQKNGGAGAAQNSHRLFSRGTLLRTSLIVGGGGVAGIIAGLLATHTSSGGQITAGTPGVGAP
jgi:hypothetical protein